MKFILLPFAILFASMTFAQDSITSKDLIDTKWISPITDSCFTSFCFNSERTVIVNECGDEWSWEIGYTLIEEHIKVNIYDSLGNIMMLKMDDGILRQTSHVQTRFPKNYIKVKEGKCE